MQHRTPRLVLPQVVRCIIHDFNRIQGAPRIERGDARVRAPAKELVEDGVHRHGPDVHDGVFLARVPGHHGVQSIKNTVPRHIDLPDQGFFRRRPEDLKDSADP